MHKTKAKHLLFCLGKLIDFVLKDFKLFKKNKIVTVITEEKHLNV